MNKWFCIIRKKDNRIIYNSMPVQECSQDEFLTQTMHIRSSDTIIDLFQSSTLEVSDFKTACYEDFHKNGKLE